MIEDDRDIITSIRKEREVLVIRLTHKPTGESVETLGLPDQKYAEVKARALEDLGEALLLAARRAGVA